MLVFLFLLAIAVFISAFAFLIGLYKVLFDKEDKAFGVKLLTYSVIIIIIGFGSCTVLLESGGI